MVDSMDRERNVVKTHGKILGMSPGGDGVVRNATVFLCFTGDPEEVKTAVGLDPRIAMRPLKDLHHIE